MLVLLRTKRMQLRNHADHKQRSAPNVKKALRHIYIYIYCIYSSKFRMLEMRDTEIALRKLSGGAAYSRSCEP